MSLLFNIRLRGHKGLRDEKCSGIIQNYFDTTEIYIG